MMSKLMRKIIAVSSRTKTSVIFINQLRVNVGVLYGDPNTTTGGKALSYFATQRINLRKVKVQKEDGITEDEGIKINVKVVKNRCAYDNPYKATSYTAIFGEGIDDTRELAQLIRETDHVTIGGSWIYMPSKENVETWEGTKLAFNGQASFITFLKDNPTFKERIRSMVQGKAVQNLSSDEIAAIEEDEKKLEQEIDA